MRIYNNTNVWDAGLDRIRFLFDEFPNVIVGVSGGKDSTVTFNLALKVAEEKNRLPLKVLFLDQEAEWNSVIEHVREIMNDPRVEPIWLQVPVKLFNATSNQKDFLYCWEEGAEWIRPKEPNSIKENTFGTDRFHKLFGAYIATVYPNTKTCYLAGVRAEESPARFVAMGNNPTYKWITYGKTLDKKKEHYTFYPLYDWGLNDIWKAIHDNNWSYSEIYDQYYKYGVSPNKMRVSNLHHETAIHALYYLQEIEGDTWEKLTRRLSGINTAGHLKKDAFTVKELPFMFNSWKEYRDYLTEHLPSDEKTKKIFKDEWELMDKKYEGMHHIEDLHKACITCLLANDYEMTKMRNWERNPHVDGWWKFKRGIFHPSNVRNKYIGLKEQK